MTEVNRNHAVSLLVLACLWLGLLIGVSFLATPVKFLAPSLSLPVALDVGRQTFSFLNPLELGLATVLLITTTMAFRKTGHARYALFICVALLLLVLLQSLWLLPVLDGRVEVILQGETPPASNLHRLYIVVDVVKLILLGALAVKQIRIFTKI